MIYYILTLILLLAGCSEKQSIQSSPVNRSSNRIKIHLPDDLEAIPVTELSQISSKVIASNAETDIAPIRKCIIHGQRKESLPYCLALWSSQNHFDADIEKEIIANIHFSRSHVLAAILKDYSLKAVSSSILLDGLAQISEDETWIKAKLISRWISDHEQNNLSFRDQDFLISFATARENDSPFDFALSNKAILQIRSSQLTESLKPYCLRLVEGPAAQRCWRVIGASINEISDPDELRILESYLPSTRDHNWQTFQLNFPQFRTQEKGGRR